MDVQPMDVLAMSEQTKLGLSTVALAAGLALIVGLLGALVVGYAARRNTATASWLAPIVVIATVATGVLASAVTMVLGDDQVLIMAAVLAVSGLLAGIVGVILARRIRQAQRLHVAAEAARQRDADVEAKRQQLVAWVSHDLRTPLARMRAMTEALQDGVAPDPAGYLRQLGSEVDSLSMLVDDLLALSRLSSAEVPLTTVAINLSDLLSDIVAATTPQAQRMGVSLVGAAEPNLPMAADVQDLNRALGNLLGNALRHTRPGSEVSLTAVRDGDEAVVKVSDECGGIPAADLAVLFEPGWRGDSARTPSPDARAGLGLAIARTVAIRHGGSITVANHAQGCTFTMRLPLLEVSGSVARQPPRGPLRP